MEDNKGTAEVVDGKFKIGDKVKVVEYGHLMFIYKERYQEESDYFAKTQAEFDNDMSKMLLGEDAVFKDLESLKGKSEPDNIYKDVGDMWWVDMSPDLISKEGVICEVTNTQGRFKYAVDGIKGKHAWYDEKQLELVKTDSVERKEGYYWVRVGEDWTIAEYTTNGCTKTKCKRCRYWTIMNYEMEYQDDNFDEIDERQICRS